MIDNIFENEIDYKLCFGSIGLGFSVKNSINEIVINASVRAVC